MPGPNLLSLEQGHSGNGFARFNGFVLSISLSPYSTFVVLTKDCRNGCADSVFPMLLFVALLCSLPIRSSVSDCFAEIIK
jgi:hypothetical protein